ncbi:MAG TPA: hypothetical protein VM537_29545 [Anaerolineae bacterium]|nr:hypothetical protein [Anaerolineae bacterium]
MSESVLLGRGRQILRLPREMWEQHLAQVPEHSGDRHRFMTEEHQRVRYFVVRELPFRGRAIAPPEIAAALHLPQTRVETILDELERKLFFLFRDEQGAVSWAYPITVEPTPHHLSFSSGERLYAA